MQWTCPHDIRFRSFKCCQDDKVECRVAYLIVWLSFVLLIPLATSLFHSWHDINTYYIPGSFFSRTSYHYIYPDKYRFPTRHDARKICRNRLIRCLSNQLSLKHHGVHDPLCVGMKELKVSAETRTGRASPRLGDGTNTTCSISGGPLTSNVAINHFYHIYSWQLLQLVDWIVVKVIQWHWDWSNCGMW